MKVRTQERLGTLAAFVTILLVAASVGWAWLEVEDAMRKRDDAKQITRASAELSVATLEYLLLRHERARVQWHLVSDRLGRLLAEAETVGRRQPRLLAELRERRSDTAEIFLRLSDLAPEPATREQAQARRLYEAHLLSRLLIYQQETLSIGFRLSELAAERIAKAQEAVIGAILAGLLVLGAVIAGASWRINRAVLAPIVRLQGAANAVAAGKLETSLRVDSGDELGALARDFNAMTRALRRSYERLQQSNRELEAFSYSVSHDLRAPLRQIDGFAEILEADLEQTLDAENRRVLAIIRDATRRMGRLIDDLLRFARAGRRELVLAPVDMTALAQQSFDELTAEANGERRLELQPLPRARGDEGMLRQVWVNLIANALKFSRARPETPVVVGGSAAAGEAVYFVRDEGVGFDMKHSTQLFGVFQRLHGEAEFEGTGVGLALVKRIVERHGGRVWAEAAEGRGATFYFSLPQEGQRDGTD